MSTPPGKGNQPRRPVGSTSARSWADVRTRFPERNAGQQTSHGRPGNPETTYPTEPAGTKYSDEPARVSRTARTSRQPAMKRFTGAVGRRGFGVQGTRTAESGITARPHPTSDHRPASHGPRNDSRESRAPPNNERHAGELRAPAGRDRRAGAATARQHRKPGARRGAAAPPAGTPPGGGKRKRPGGERHQRQHQRRETSAPPISTRIL